VQVSRTLRGLLVACHPGPTLVVTAVATALAIEVGRGEASTWVALAVLAGQLSVGWSNDSLDADRDALAGRAEKPVVAGLLARRTVAIAALGALIACVPLSLASGWRAGCIHLVAVASAWAYNLGLKATWLSPLPYALSFALLPAFVTMGLPGSPWPRAGVMVVAALLGLGAHFINTVPDYAADELGGVDGLPQRLGPRRSLVVGVLLLGASALVIAVLCAHRSTASTLLVLCALLADGVVLEAAAHRRERQAWRFTLVTAGFCVAAFVAAGSQVLLA
jgi:4-hydroxybenzoate polyprenyltransferase